MYFDKLFLLAIGMILCHVVVEGAPSDTANSDKSNSTIPAEKQSNPAPVQSALFPTDLTLKSGFGQALIYVGAAAFSFILVGGLTLLIAPLFGYRICSVLGNCDPITTYSAAPNTLQNAAQSNSYPDNLYGAYYATSPYTGYQKRSIDYIKPILESLASVYEKKSA